MDVGIKNAEIGTTALLEGGIVIGTESLGCLISDDADLKRISACANQQGLRYVESENHIYARSAMCGQVRKQRRNHGAMAMADDGYCHLLETFRGWDVFLSQTDCPGGLKSNNRSAQAESLQWDKTQLLFTDSGSMNSVCHKLPMASKSPSRYFVQAKAAI